MVCVSSTKPLTAVDSLLIAVVIRRRSSGPLGGTISHLSLVTFDLEEGGER